jgi:hypothetical protein
MLTNTIIDIKSKAGLRGVRGKGFPFASHPINQTTGSASNARLRLGEGNNKKGMAMISNSQEKRSMRLIKDFTRLFLRY